MVARETSLPLLRILSGMDSAPGAANFWQLFAMLRNPVGIMRKGAIRIDGGDILIQLESSPETHEQRIQDRGTSIHERDRAHFLQTSDRF